MPGSFVRAVSLLLLASTSLLPCRASDFDQYRRNGEDAFSGNNYGVAERNFVKALEEAEKFGPKDLRLAAILKNLGALYMARGQFAKAQPYLERELRTREKALGGEHPDVVKLAGNLAQFYLNHGNPAKADKLAALLVNFASKKLSEQAKVEAKIKELQHVFSTQPGYAEPLQISKHLEECSKKVRANYFLELAAILDTLGELYKSRNNLQTAEQAYKSSLALRESSLSPQHLALAASYDHLGDLYSAQGKTELAEANYKRALEVTEKAVELDGPDVFRRIDSLAKAELGLGHRGQAEALYRRALLALDKTRANSPDAGQTCFALANLYVKQGRVSEAEPLMKRAMLITESNNGPQHAALSPVLDAYAELLSKLHKSSEAAKVRSRAKSIREGSLVQACEADSF